MELRQWFNYSFNSTLVQLKDVVNGNRQRIANVSILP